MVVMVAGVVPQARQVAAIVSFSSVSAAQVRSAERALLAEERHVGRSSAHSTPGAAGAVGPGSCRHPGTAVALLVGVEVAAELSLSVRCAGCRRRFASPALMPTARHKSGQARATSRAKMDAQGHERKLQSCVLAHHKCQSASQSLSVTTTRSPGTGGSAGAPAAPKKAETAPTIAQTVQTAARGCAVNASAGAGANSARFLPSCAVVQGSQNSTSASAHADTSTGADAGAQADASPACGDTQ